MRRLDEILNIKYPIIQGGMASIATGEFAAACSNAGALGIIACGGLNSKEELEEEIQKARALTDRPFGVNIMLMHPLAEEFGQVVAEQKVSVVTTGAGMPGKMVHAWKEQGIFVVPVAAAPVMAQLFERQKVDAIICEGTESGGHVGEMTTMALVPQAKEATHLPIIAAGGIASGAQIAAAFALGACGVQIGTALLASQECPIHEEYKNALLKAKGSDTTVTGRIAGTPVRIIKNKMSREYIKREKEGASIEELEQYTLGSLRRAVKDGDTSTGSLMAGQVCGQLREIRPVKEIIETMWQEAMTCASQLHSTLS